MIDNILQIIAPHHCYGCGKTGPLLCANCKYDIISDPFVGCIVCRKPARDGICHGCRTYYDKAWCVGERHDILEAIINGYKFNRIRSAHRVFAELLDESLPLLPSTTIVVPVPTINTHIRQRGYDHTLLMAKRFAQLRGLSVHYSLLRVTDTKQLGATREMRFAQAKDAIQVRQAITSNRPYLLIDDVVTTGATLQYAAKALHDAGAHSIWVGAIARQPLDKPDCHLLEYVESLPNLER